MDIATRKKKKAYKLYRKTAKGKAARKRARIRYRNSKKGKAARKRYVRKKAAQARNGD